MFFYNIAFSLELLVIGLGALLVSWAIHTKECTEGVATHEQVRTNLGNTEVAKTYHAKHCGGVGFAQVIGIILIILALINLVDTAYGLAKFKHHVRKMHDRIENTTYNPNTVNTNNSPSTSTTPAQPVNNSTAPENSGY